MMEVHVYKHTVLLILYMYMYWVCAYVLCPTVPGAPQMFVVMERHTGIQIIVHWRRFQSLPCRDESKGIYMYM